MKEESSVAERREFGFAPAFFVATVAHAVIALLLHYNSLNADVPPPQPPPQPLQIRFVKVPQQMPLLPENGTPHPASGSAGSGAPPPRRIAQATMPQPRRVESSVQRAPENFQQATPAQNPDIAIPSSRGQAANYPELANSLQNLDHYISPGGGSGTGGGGSGAGGQGADSGAGAYFDTQGFDLGPWGDEVVARVKRNWSIPPAADLGMKGVVGVAFNVGHDGHLEDIHVVSSSGIPSFDQAAINALRISDPFIPLPTGFPRPKLPAIFRFFYNVPVPRN